MGKAILFFMATLFMVVCAVDGYADINVTNCSTLNETNSVYVLQNNINTTTTCFTIAANNITLDLNGHSVNSTLSTNIVNIIGYNYTTVKNGIFNGFNEGILFDNNTINNSIYNINMYNSGRGLSLIATHDNNFYNINISNCTGTACIYLAPNAGGMVYNNIFNNTIISTANKGIYLNAILSSRTIVNNTFYNTIINNIFLTVPAGIIIGGSSENKFYNTTIYNSSKGVYIDSSSTTVFSDNNLFNNLNLYNNTLDLFFTRTNGRNNIFKDSSIGSYNFTTITRKINISIQTSNKGEIFLFNINGTGSNFSNDIFLDTNLARVNSTQIGLNKSANITLLNLPTNFINPKIMKDGIECTDCYNFTSLNAGNVLFNVSGWSSYYIAGDVISPLIAHLHIKQKLSIGNGRLRLRI